MTIAGGSNVPATIGETGKPFGAALALVATLAITPACSRREATSESRTAPAPGELARRSTSANSPSPSPSPNRAPAKAATAESPPAPQGPCGDERDAIIQGYRDLGVGLELRCSDFTRTRHTEYFAFSDLNGKGQFGWALLRDPLLAGKDKGYGLDKLREAYGETRRINSAYRDPVHNKQQGGARRSRHMFGDAADLRNEKKSREEWDRMWTAAEKSQADYIEPLSGPCQLNCLHADWRNHEGEYGQ
jgi:hypothetical protein